MAKPGTGEVEGALRAAAAREVPLKIFEPEASRLLPHYRARLALIRPTTWRGAETLSP